MFNEKGQAFDAFKLLIAAVVAGAILVIILGMLQGFIVPVGQPMHVMTQGISTVSKATGSGTVSPQRVQFVKGDILSSEGISDQAGVNKGTVCLCSKTFAETDADFISTGDSTTKCDSNYYFTATFFTVTGSCFTGDNLMTLTAKEDANGKIRVYYDGDKYYVGFNTEG